MDERWSRRSNVFSQLWGSIGYSPNTLQTLQNENQQRSFKLALSSSGIITQFKTSRNKGTEWIFRYRFFYFDGHRLLFLQYKSMYHQSIDKYMQMLLTTYRTGRVNFLNRVLRSVLCLGHSQTHPTFTTVTIKGYKTCEAFNFEHIAGNWWSGNDSCIRWNPKHSLSTSQP